MLTKLIIRHFKRFQQVEIELGNPVVFVGPNNSGKTTALQALALWGVGLHTWNEKRAGGSARKRAGVTINRRDLLSIPSLRTSAFWRGLRVRNANELIRIEVIVEGITKNIPWTCGLEFDSVDADNIRCRPIGQLAASDLIDIKSEALEVQIALLPPMSGLASQEDRLQPGSIQRRLGEGRTAEVLRNLCYTLSEDQPERWQLLVGQLQKMFGMVLQTPAYDERTGIISLQYEEQVAGNATLLDLTASGQGFRQTLLLLAYMYSNPGAVLLLDEPDAHLEVLRQQQIYDELITASRTNDNQLMIATHSEVLLDKAGQGDLVIAFIGAPHPVNKSEDLKKALAEYGYQDYYRAEQTGWVLYVEGETDLRILQAFATRLQHPASAYLDKSFVRIMNGDEPPLAYRHFKAMKEAIPTLTGFVLFDRLTRNFDPPPPLKLYTWKRREIENYLAFPETLLNFAAEGKDDDDQDLWLRRQRTIMDEVLKDFIPPIAMRDRTDRYWSDTKMSTELLDRLFPEYYKRLGVPNALNKSGYYRLADFVPLTLIAPEVRDVLDQIDSVAQAASQRTSALAG